MRIMAIDPGEKNIGIAISDPTGTIANPFTILTHVSRLVDAASISALAHEQGVQLIVVGQVLDEDGLPTPQSRRSARLAAALRTQSLLPVVLWDEGGSTQVVRQARRAMGATTRKRSGHIDDLAATFILQTYLDSRTGYHGTVE
jgi:putative Holliday junction resolvase